jgi:hypothetical protein
LPNLLFGLSSFEPSLSEERVVFLNGLPEDRPAPENDLEEFVLEFPLRPAERPPSLLALGIWFF